MPEGASDLLAGLMTAEAKRCLGEEVVESPDDIDLAMVLGTGYSPFRGGPMQFGKEDK
jgi:3-hydroxyacyl-CoA dehydrogenase / enoyl-CoA hydratase / 3-hydroxybutyryl-CoA epimerase